ncbi:MAG: hypothetical protein AAFQ83_04090 [Bacteroidota bacterium]
MDWEILEKEWKALESQQPEESWDRDGLLQVINRKSQHTLQKIRRNVLAEVVMTLLPFAVGIVYFIQNPGTPELFIYLVTAFTLCSASFYLYKYWLLRPSAYISLPTKEALEKSLHIMSLYRTIYIVSSTLFVPLVAGMGVWIGFFAGAYQEGMTWQDLTVLQWVAISLTTILYVTIAVQFFRWYIRRLYGNSIEVLRTNLKELSESI